MIHCIKIMTNNNTNTIDDAIAEELKLGTIDMLFKESRETNIDPCELLVVITQAIGRYHNVYDKFMRYNDDEKDCRRSYMIGAVRDYIWFDGYNI